MQPMITAPPPPDCIFELKAPESSPFDEDEEQLARAVALSLQESIESHSGRRTPTGTDLDQLEEAIALSRIER